MLNILSGSSDIRNINGNIVWTGFFNPCLEVWTGFSVLKNSLGISPLFERIWVFRNEDKCLEEEEFEHLGMRTSVAKRTRPTLISVKLLLLCMYLIDKSTLNLYHYLPWSWRFYHINKYIIRYWIYQQIYGVLSKNNVFKKKKSQTRPLTKIIHISHLNIHMA